MPAIHYSHIISIMMVMLFLFASHRHMHRINEKRGRRERLANVLGRGPTPPWAGRAAVAVGASEILGVGVVVAWRAVIT